ncbi:hypothetical protein SAMN06265365_103361 [Tistlia consotensis]|uniref:ER-bound oxygenase mpaB/mpaB'/Rubber oxygenase catalytic domain-containing protein n=1 Tax=Tistlia consotensis USBA 355 TaxID=560819 RepID=A0A1Y6CA13_9PROT|nr:oxygenase MpaB family protein [Tistlia consotensis]SMF44368.1 hypothetical protein SAMN05428998_115123 [Tistlia consotensis USBA 355]SNR43213.1 hypothetical protein SAMN06265365_103361 [Tistlia consotensis]
MFTATSSPAPLSPERIAAARARHGSAVDQYLRHLQLGDPTADALVELFETLPRGQGMAMVVRAIDHGIEAVEDPPAPLLALFRELDHVPFWVDWRRMRFGSRKILRSGLLTGFAFACYALPHSYLASANKPLAMTGALLDHTAHRYAQTSRFVIETFMPDGLRRQSDGFKIAVLVRLMHARTRRRLLQSGEWDVEAWGLPLNQAHMALNTVYFSFHVLRGLQKLGVRFSRAEVEGVLLTWRYVGHLFGIDPELVYTSEEEALRLIEIASSVECDPDATSRRLCQAMFDAGPEYLGIENPWLARRFKSLTYRISRHLLGDSLADGLGYPPQRHRLLCSALAVLVRLLEWAPFLVPPAVSRYTGVGFWLEASDYDLAPLVGDRPPY